MKFDKEFKTAISHLTSNDKDKLILRLLKKDYILAERLYFELVSTDSVEDQRNLIEKKISKRVKATSNRFCSAGYLMMALRYLSGDITEHVKITKDKFGEVSLNLFLMTESLNLNNNHILSQPEKKAYKFSIYIIAKAFKTIILIDKLHQDFRIDFNDQLIKLGKLISDNDYLMQVAVNNGFDVNWLLKANFPGNIKDIHKDIRANGFLK